MECAGRLLEEALVTLLRGQVLTHVKGDLGDPVSSNFSYLYVCSLNAFSASLCLQETAVCFGHPHLHVVSSS